MLELKEGVVARITKDEFPENIGKRVMLRARPTTDVIAKEDLNKIKGWLAWPVDDIIVERHGNNMGTTIFDGGQETYLFHLIVKDEEIEASEADNDGTVKYEFTQHPLDHLLNTGYDGCVTGR